MMIIVAAFGLHLRAQETGDTPKAAYVDDWTHHHVVFSNPGTQEDAAKRGELGKWQRINNDPRYKLQQIKRGLGSLPVVADSRHEHGWDDSRDGNRDRDHRGGGGPGGTTGNGVKKDWSVLLGNGEATLTLTLANVTVGNVTGGTSQLVVTAGSTATITASAPTPETGTLAFVTPGNGTTLVFGGITYNFTSTITFGTPGTGICTIYRGSGSNNTTETYLLGAMGASGGATAGTSKWECGSLAAQSFSVTGFVNGTTHTISVAANTVGPSSSFGTPNFGSTGISWSSGPTAGTWGLSDGTDFAYYTSGVLDTAAQLATSLAASINASTVAGNVTAYANTPSSGFLTIAADAGGTTANAYTVSVTSFGAVTAGTGTMSGGETARVQPNAFPAKFGASLTTASCANDFVVYPTGQSGAAGAASIIAYNQIYGVTGSSGCGTTATVPSVYWAYNTATSTAPGESVTNSPVISLDGTQIAYMQTNGAYASLVLLKWSASGGSMTAPVTLANQGTSGYRGCTAPCMVSIELNPTGSTDDSFSAPYYDYVTDTIFVGDDNGKLHKFTGVFVGTPGEAVGGGWPAPLGTHAVSSPVYDSGSQRVYVGDMFGVLYSVSPSNGTFYSTGTTNLLDTSGIADAPLLNGTGSSLLVFVNQSGAYSWTGYNAIYEFPTGFTSFGSPGVAALTPGGVTGSAGHYLYAGTFDNAFYTTGTGNIYVVANTGVTTGAILYKVPFSGGLGTVVNALGSTLLTASGAYPWPSSVTEFYNAGIDYVFFSVNDPVTAATACTTGAGNGCILSYNVTNSALVVRAGSGLTVTTPASPGCWATGGIVLDNAATNVTGDSQIYFVNLNGAAAGGPNGATSALCAAGVSPTIQAVQATQSNP